MKKQNFIITSLFLFWVIGTTTAQTITGKVTNIHAQAIDGATVILQTIDSTFVDAVITDTTGYFRFNRQTSILSADFPTHHVRNPLIDNYRRRRRHDYPEK